MWAARDTSDRRASELASEVARTKQRSHLAPRLAAAGVEYRRAAEDLAKGPHSRSPAETADVLLMAGSEHRVTILDTEFDRSEIGVVKEANTYWITQVCIAP